MFRGTHGTVWSHWVPCIELLLCVELSSGFLPTFSDLTLETHEVGTVPVGLTRVNVLTIRVRAELCVQSSWVQFPLLPLRGEGKGGPVFTIDKGEWPRGKQIPPHTHPQKSRDRGLHERSFSRTRHPSYLMSSSFPADLFLFRLGRHRPR